MLSAPVFGELVSTVEITAEKTEEQTDSVKKIPRQRALCGPTAGGFFVVRRFTRWVSKPPVYCNISKGRRTPKSFQNRTLSCCWGRLQGQADRSMRRTMNRRLHYRQQIPPGILQVFDCSGFAQKVFICRFCGLPWPAMGTSHTFSNLVFSQHTAGLDMDLAACG